MRICNQNVLRAVSELIHKGITVTRDMQEQLEREFMLPTFEEFKESPEAQLYLRTIYDVRVAGNNPEKGRNWMSWVKYTEGSMDVFQTHSKHAREHYFRIHHNQSPFSQDELGQGYDLDHLLTRVAMMVYIKNELEKASITALPESNPED